jgi:hypothetical protein
MQKQSIKTYNNMVKHIRKILNQISFIGMPEVTREDAVNDVADAIVDTLTKSYLLGKKLSAEEISTVLSRIRPRLIEYISYQKDEVSYSIKKQIEETEINKILANEKIANMESIINELPFFLSNGRNDV